MSLKTVTLNDPSGSCAKILVDYGFNCYSFQIAIDDKLSEVLWTEDRFDSGERRPSGSGIPILFPFPGRIAGTEFQYEGKTYSLEAGDGQGNAIHGFVLDRPWRVVQQSDQSVTGEFQASVDDPTLLDRWPSDFKIRVSYQLSGNELIMQSTFSNPGENPGDDLLPCGLGLHPYFRVPLGPALDADCVVQVPVSEYWELLEMNATGKRLPCHSRGDLKRGMPFSETQFDDVFTALEFNDGQCTTRITDLKNRRKLTLTFDDLFQQCVIYNPPHREAICIEPYSCVPGAKSLQDQGIDAGLIELQPAQEVSAKMVIRVDVI